MGRLGHRSRRDDGAAAVEFALVLPILVMTVFGIINFGVVFAQHLAVGNAAREAARYAAVEGPSCTDITGKAADLSKHTLAPGQLKAESITAGVGGTNCVSDPPCKDSAEDSSVTVTITYESELLVPIPIYGLPDSVDVKGVGEFRCEFA